MKSDQSLARAREKAHPNTEMLSSRCLARSKHWVWHLQTKSLTPWISKTHSGTKSTTLARTMKRILRRRQITRRRIIRQRHECQLQWLLNHLVTSHPSQLRKLSNHRSNIQKPPVKIRPVKIRLQRLKEAKIRAQKLEPKILAQSWKHPLCPNSRPTRPYPFKKSILCVKTPGWAENLSQLKIKLCIRLSKCRSCSRLTKRRSMFSRRSFMWCAVSFSRWR